jgi:hypothetical protein
MATSTVSDWANDACIVSASQPSNTDFRDWQTAYRPGEYSISDRSAIFSAVLNARHRQRGRRAKDNETHDTRFRATYRDGGHSPEEVE